MCFDSTDVNTDIFKEYIESNKNYIFIYQNNIRINKMGIKEIIIKNRNFNNKLG